MKKLTAKERQRSLASLPDTIAPLLTQSLYFERRFLNLKFAKKLHERHFLSWSKLSFSVLGFSNFTQTKEQFALVTRWFSQITRLNPFDFAVRLNISKSKSKGFGQKTRLLGIKLYLAKSSIGTFVVLWKHLFADVFKDLSTNQSTSYRMTPFSVGSKLTFFGLHQLPLAVIGIASTNPAINLSLSLTLPQGIFVPTIPSKILPRIMQFEAKTRLNCILTSLRLKQKIKNF
jgi:hypothetical protein